jgi:hypothetical protein
VITARLDTQAKWPLYSTQRMLKHKKASIAETRRKWVINKEEEE